MKIRHTIAMGIVSLTTTAVFAANSTDTPSGATTKSRSQVRQEAIAARAAGQKGVGEEVSYPNTPAKAIAHPAKRKAKPAQVSPDAGKS